ncbi:TPA: hypothetical protein ACH3X2_001483 [Trebouxia sp. C0005]
MAHCSCGLLTQTPFASSQRFYNRISVRPQQQSRPLRPVPQVRKALRQSKARAWAVQAAATAEVGKLIAMTEIPAFIPRQDLMDQLLRWAYTEVQEESVRKFGLPCKVLRTQREGIPWGFVTSITRDGVTLTDISVSFDEEVVYKYDWVGKAADGFPQMEGNAEEIMGKHFVIRKVDDNTIDEQTRSVIRLLCQEIQASINKYYAFGSCFVDDAT